MTDDEPPRPVPKEPQNATQNKRHHLILSQIKIKRSKSKKDHHSGLPPLLLNTPAISNLTTGRSISKLRLGTSRPPGVRGFATLTLPRRCSLARPSSSALSDADDDESSSPTCGSGSSSPSGGISGPLPSRGRLGRELARWLNGSTSPFSTVPVSVLGPDTGGCTDADGSAVSVSVSVSVPGPIVPASLLPLSDVRPPLPLPGVAGGGVADAGAGDSPPLPFAPCDIPSYTASRAK